MVEPQSKKIRLLSFQNAYNFGAVLQAFGLQQTIRSIGYNDVKFIYYNPKYLSSRYSPFTKECLFPYSSLKGFLSWCVHYPFFLISRVFRNFRIKKSIKELLIQTDKLITDEKGLNSIEADVLICGSDQIWNTELTGGFDVVFFGKGPYKYLGQSASYAASTEISSLTEEKAQKLSLLLDSFRFVSVREIQVKERLEPFWGHNIQVCVDPSILCGVEDYLQITSPRLEKRNYVLVYAYDYNDLVITDLIKSIPHYEKYIIHVVLLGTKTLKTFFKANIHAAISVQDFLSYMKYADYIVTNSFHGLAFSLLFEKNFYVAYCEGKHVRCLSLLQQLGLEDRFVHDGKVAKWDMVDYSIINDRIKSIKQESFEYLKRVIE